MDSTSQTPLKVGVLISPNVALMDLFGVHAVFGMADNIELHILWKNRELLDGSPLFSTAATTTFDESPELEVLIVGAVPPEVIADTEVINFIIKQAEHDPYLIGICGGVLLYGAAGLLEGRKATTNFHLLDTLPALGATVIEGGQVVKDNKLYTAGPATGEFEAALLVLALLRGEAAAKLMELTIQYHPQPPFGVGTPELAGERLTEQAKGIYKEYFSACSNAAINIFTTKS